MSNINTAQLRFFHCEAEVQGSQAQSSNFTREQLWELFRLEYEALRIYPEAQTLIVECPKTEAIAEMGRKQVRRYRTSHRLRQDCDRVSMLGKCAWSKYLGEPAHEVFDAWNDALGKGNKGIFFNIPGENIGLRTTTGTQGKFIYSRNRHESWITAMVFARVQMQHSGAAFVELLGWTHKNRIAAFIKDRGQILEVNINRIQSAGLLLTPEDLKERFADAFGRGWNNEPD
jgi:hypothetical protein